MLLLITSVYITFMDSSTNINFGHLYGISHYKAMNFVWLYLAVSAHKWLGALFPVLHITYVVIMLVWILTNYMLWCTWKVSKLTDYNKEGMVYALIAGH